jgi:hypothetical protein
MSPTATIATIREQLQTALETLDLLEQSVVSGNDPGKEQHGYDPEWFLPGSKNLSPKGVDFLYDLFSKGVSRNAAARIMGISYTACNYRWSKWRMGQH